MPFITTYDSGKPSTKPKETEALENFIIANYHAVWPLDHDDGSCYYYDHDNVLVYGGFKTYLGHSKTCRRGVLFPRSHEQPLHLPRHQVRRRHQ